MDESKVIEEYTKHFMDKFQFQFRRNQFCFIDNFVDADEGASDLEKQMFNKALS